ncbi:hypothetical protein BDR22DRAFT_884552 [Usnea florida]
MNLTTSLLALTSQNLSSTPLQDIAGYSFCQAFYGKFSRSSDCVRAVGLLEKGASEVAYSVHSGHPPHSLPLSKSFGDCMVQVDLAGPRLPQTYNIIPDDIGHMASQVLSSCVTGPSEVGGFATSDLQVMNGWLTNAETRLDRPFPTSTAFLTVTITQKVPDWLSPGNYDPIVAYHFAEVLYKAIDRTFLLRDRIELRKRAERLLRQGEKMRPRGNRVPWWENPDLGAEVNATSLDTGSGTVNITLPDSQASGADTAS